MQRSNILLLALAFCLLCSFTTRAGSSSSSSYNGGKPSYSGTQPSYSGGQTYEEEEEYSYYGGHEEEEEEEEYSYYGGHEEEEEYSYYGGHEEVEEEYSYYGGHEEEVEEEYSYYGGEEEEEESYTYNGGSYGSTYGSSYGQGNSSSGYSSGSGYSGSYDSSKPASIPKFPTSLLTGFVVDIHLFAVDITIQYVAFHYCSELFPGFTQCAIFNGTGANSAMIATEQIVSAEIFATLPLEERKLYHSHAYSAKNGLLVIPGLSGEAELQAMQGVMNTYGKVVNYWPNGDSIPMGTPSLSYGIADDSQLDTNIIDQMDKALNLGTTWLERKQQRAGLKMPTIIEGANDYLTSGIFPQYVTQYFKVRPTN